MKNKNRILVILIIIYVFITIIFTLFLNKNNEFYIGNVTKVTIYKNKIVVKNKNNKLYNKKAKVYFNGQFIDAYIYSLDSGFYQNYKAVDQYKNNLQFNDDFIAYTGSKKINIVKPHENLITNSELDKISSELELDKNRIDLNKSKKYLFDLNSDGDKESLFSVRYGKDEKEFISYFVLISNNKMSVFEKYKTKKNAMTMNEETIYRFIDFYNKGNFTLAIQYVPKDEMPHQYKFFKFENNKLVKIK